MTWLVAGLGNPGDRFAETRHNLGRMVVDELARRSGARFRKARFVAADVAELKEGGDRVLLAKARTYMNGSGPSYASLARRHGIEPDHVVAVHDDIDLAFAALRVKFGGSTAGHQGLNSLVGALRTPDFHRVRLGIGRPHGRQDPVEYVLEDFTERERVEVETLVDEAADAVLSLIREGLSVTQDRFNRPGPRA
jgi:PTH1 family peptidyl-tRNA hydrolase